MDKLLAGNLPPKKCCAYSIVYHRVYYPVFIVEKLVEKSSVSVQLRVRGSDSFYKKSCNFAQARLLSCTDCFLYSNLKFAQ